MIHIVCYLRGGDPGREGRQLWSAAWPPCTTLGLPRWPACLSVWSSGSHPPLVVLIASLFITLLSSTSAPPHPHPPLLSSPRSSPTFLSSHLTPSSTRPPATHNHPPPPLPPSLSPESGSALNFSSQATCCLPEPKNAATRGTDRGPSFWHKERNKSIKKKETQNKDG